MTKRFHFISIAAAVALVIGGGVLTTRAQNQDKNARPPVVTPGNYDSSSPPSDAVVLFDGKDLSNWAGNKGEAQWDVKDGNMITNRTGNIWTKGEFGSFQLHLEFATPSEVKGNSQGRGNSGVYLHGRYEVQVLDSFENDTNPTGQCGAIYGLHVPLVNASRKPGEWQTYDIIFNAPKFDADGKKIADPTITVLHNGVLIQDHKTAPRTTTAAKFKDMTPTGPILLQDHGNPVRYRNIWLRELD